MKGKVIFLLLGHQKAIITNFMTNFRGEGIRLLFISRIGRLINKGNVIFILNEEKNTVLGMGY